MDTEFDMPCPFHAFNWQNASTRTAHASFFQSLFTPRRTGGALIAVRKVNLPEAQILTTG